MNDFEMCLFCLLVPVAYVLIYIAGKYDVLTLVCNALKEELTRSLRHGRWDIKEGTKTRRICSECGWDVPEYGKFYSFCPKCGARMDGGADND